MCVAAVLVALLFLWVVPARPRAAIQVAQSFVEDLRSHELEQAYQLTTQQAEVGRSLEEFQNVVRQQWPAIPPASVRFLEARPRQAYGNRLRRWWRGQKMDPPQAWLEFTVDGMPFQVRARRMDGGGWKVDFFESHAG